MNVTRRKKRTANIGIFGVGFHKYWPQFDGLLDELGRAADASEMESPLREIQRQFHEDQPYTLLYEAQRIAAHGPRLRDVVIDVPSDPLGRLERFRVATP